MVMSAPHCVTKLKIAHFKRWVELDVRSAKGRVESAVVDAVHEDRGICRLDRHGDEEIAARTLRRGRVTFGRRLSRGSSQWRVAHPDDLYVAQQEARAVDVVVVE